MSRLLLISLITFHFFSLDFQFQRHFELIVDELYNRNKNIESINENNSITNATIGQTIDNLIEVNICFFTNILQTIVIKNVLIVFHSWLQKQKRIDKINETIVEKTLDLNDIKSEETRLEAVRRVVCPPNEICFDTIKDQLRQSPNDS